MIDEIFKSITSLDELADKSSSVYKEATLYGDIEKVTRKEEIPDPLKDALKEATHLDDKTKERYIYLANVYLSDMGNNIFKNQFDLSDKYTDITKDEWNDFLSDRIVSVYINKHKRTLLKTAAEENLSSIGGRNKRDSLQVIKNIKEEEQTESNKNICIIRIPDKYEGGDDNEKI